MMKKMTKILPALVMAFAMAFTMMLIAAGTGTAHTASVKDDQDEPKIVSHDPYKHAKKSRITQEYGSNTVYLHCEWEEELPVFGKKVCQFKDWPLLIMNRTDDYYDGKPKEPNFYTLNMNNNPFWDITDGFPYDYAQWDGKFTYTGINGTVEYGPSTDAPIGEGTYYVYATVKIPSAKTIMSDGTFILGKTFTIEPSDYDVTFDANVPDNASTKDELTGAMPKIHFNSKVDSRQLPPNQFSLPGYQFDSWNTKPDGSGERYENNQIAKRISYVGKDATLYAQWKPKSYTVTYNPGDAVGDSVSETAYFDRHAKLKPVGENGWIYDNHAFFGWATDGFGHYYADQEDYVNLCGKPGYGGDLQDVVLSAQWVENGKIIVVVTKDGMPQEGLKDEFALIDTDETRFTMPTDYENGKYIYPSEAQEPGQQPAQLPPGEYDLCFDAKGYTKSSVRIQYGNSYAVSTIFDYYTVTLEADPAYKDVHKVEMPGREPEEDGSYKAVIRDGDKLKIRTTVEDGYHFDGYSAAGVAPLWEGGDNMKAEQTIEVEGQADIMAHVEANAYTVRFDANTKAPVIGKMEDQDMVYDEPQELFANEFVRGGAVFTGWNTKADGSGTAYKDKQSVKNLTAKNGETITLYAQWKETPVKTALLTFDLAGGTLDGKTGSFDVRANVGDVIKMPAAPTRNGYTFMYWKGSELHPGDKYTVKGDHTFTAIWKKNDQPDPKPTPKPDPKPTPSSKKVSGTIIAKMTAKGKTGLTIRWKKIKGAKGYDIFFARCAHSEKKTVCKKVKTIKGNKKSKWTKKGLKKGTAYKAYVKAYIKKNGKKKYVRKSPIMHAYAGNVTKKHTNAKAVKVKKAKVTLNKGRSFKIKAKVIKVSKKKKLMPKSHAPTLRYKTSYKKIATVSKTGRIKAKGKGKCKIYVFAHNGVSKTITVSVK